MATSPIDFSGIAAALLARAESLVPEWLPGGRRQGREWVCADASGGRGRSFSVNLESGAFADFSSDVKGGDLIALYAAIHGLSQAAAALELAAKIGYGGAHYADHSRPSNGAFTNGHATSESAAEQAPESVTLPAPSGMQSRWCYYPANEGGPILVVCRLLDPEKGKTYRQYTWRGGRWAAKSLGSDRPLYRLRELFESPEAPVLLVEGEKCADAAIAALPASWCVTTWSQGSNAAKSTDFSPLYGRTVTIWPDADEPGRKVAAQIAGELANNRSRVSIVAVDGRPKGWDCADASSDEIRSLIASAKILESPIAARGADAPLDENPPLEAYAADPEFGAQRPTATLQDFYAYLPQHQYLYIPTRELWPAASVNAVVITEGGKAANILDMERPVHQMTWAPSDPMVIKDKLVSDGGWIERDGAQVFNLYRAPQPISGDASLATPWIEHLCKIYPDEAPHLIFWLAHRVQRPGEKLNHAIVLGGAQGIGKDSLLEPVKYAVGHWNFSEVTPPQLLGRFNGFLKCVILRMSEARDLGDVDRYALYEHLKPLTAAPPDVLRVDEKNIREHSVMNVCGVVVTTNHIDGIFLPPDDRRHFVAWSELTREDFDPEYWRTLYGWYQNGGIGHVCEFLRSVDLSAFDPKAPPPKTAAWHRMVDAGRSPEDGELSDALDRYAETHQVGPVAEWPAAITISQIADNASQEFANWLQDRRNSRQVPHRMEAVGYVPVRNTGQSDGRWKVAKKNVVIYARKQLQLCDRIAAASKISTVGRS